jgi:hypothetical protein
MPLQGALVHINAACLSCGPWPSGVHESPTDAAGRYEISGLPLRDETRWIQASKSSDYFQQCARPVVLNGRTTTLNIPLTRDANLSSSTPAMPASPNTRIISGLVFRTLDGARQPLAGAFVSFVPDPVVAFDFSAATTKTDGSGRYLLCGLPTTTIQLVTSGTDVSVSAGSDALVDIELK